MLSPGEFVDSYAVIGANKAKASALKLLVLAILAGFLIGMGGAAANTAAHAISNVSAAKIICGLLFPFGLVMVILTGAELFTGNCLITISVLSKQAAVWEMLRNWAIVYIGNFIGSVSLAAACAYGGQMNLSAGGLGSYVIRVAAAKCSLPFTHALTLGILCNILVCIAVMCALCAKDVAGRAIGAFVPITFFVISGFEHSVANMYYIPAGLFALSVPKYAALAASAGVQTGALTWGNFFLRNLLPVTVGNIIGGCGFAALIWASQRHSYGPDKAASGADASVS